MKTMIKTAIAAITLAVAGTSAHAVLNCHEWKNSQHPAYYGGDFHVNLHAGNRMSRMCEYEYADWHFLPGSQMYPPSIDPNGSVQMYGGYIGTGGYGIVDARVLWNRQVNSKWTRTIIGTQDGPYFKMVLLDVKSVGVNNMTIWRVSDARYSTTGWDWASATPITADQSGYYFSSFTLKSGSFQKVNWGDVPSVGGGDSYVPLNYPAKHNWVKVDGLTSSSLNKVIIDGGWTNPVEVSRDNFVRMDDGGFQIIWSEGGYQKRVTVYADGGYFKIDAAAYRRGTSGNWTTGYVATSVNANGYGIKGIDVSGPR